MKIKYKFFLLFLSVIFANSILSFLFVNRTTETTFRSFLYSGDSAKAEIYAKILTAYYLEHGNWDDAGEFLKQIPISLARILDTQLHGNSSSLLLSGYNSEDLDILFSDRIVVADSTGLIVADTANHLTGTVHPQVHLDHGIHMNKQAGTHSGAIIGTILVGSMIDSSFSGRAEIFLNNVLSSLLFSMLVSALISLLIGLLLSTQIAGPLAKLSFASRQIARRNPFPPLEIKGNDEIASLSLAFNDMNSRLDRLDTAKKQIIADSAHELRTPVTLILGLTEGMLDGVYPLDKETIKSVHEETVRLSKLIGDLRELEKIESSDFELQKENANLLPVLTRSVTLFSKEASNKKIKLSLDVMEQGDIQLDFDILRIGQVVDNLISNAVKYTPEQGQVLVRYGMEKTETSLQTIFFSVEDTGAGIPENEATLIFQRFYRIDKARTSKTGGRGLGLAIAWEIIAAHGGTINVDKSALGGARFTVRLPRDQK